MAAQVRQRSKQGPPRRLLYISYSSRDRKLLEQLLVHLRPLEQDVEVFYDQLVAPGTKWTDALMRRLAESSIVLFLVSADSLASEFCQHEIQVAVSQSDTKLLIPIILSPCDWFGTPLARYQALPRDAKPLTTWKKRSEAFDDIVRGIRATIGASPGRTEDTLPAKHAAAVRRIAVSPDGTRAVTASDDGTAIVWDLATMRPAFVLVGHDGSVTDVEVAPDGQTILTASDDSTIRIWDLATGAALMTLSCSGQPVGLAVAQDVVITGLRDSHTLMVWDRDTGVLRTDVELASSPGIADIVAAPDGQTFVCAHQDGGCDWWSFATRIETRSEWKVASAPIREIRALPDSVHYASCSENGSIQMFSVRGEVREFEMSPSAIAGISPLPDGRHAVIACADGLKLCDLATGAVIRELPLPADPPAAVTTTPDGTRAVWGASNGNVSAWAIDTTVQRPLPEGRDRLKLAYLAVLEMPELWRVLETFDEAALSGIGAQLHLSPDQDVLQFLIARRPDAEPPPLWAAWMETLHHAKLGRGQKLR